MASFLLSGHFQNTVGLSKPLFLKQNVFGTNSFKSITAFIELLSLFCTQPDCNPVHSLHKSTVTNAESFRKNPVLKSISICISVEKHKGRGGDEEDKD